MEQSVQKCKTPISFKKPKVCLKWFRFLCQEKKNWTQTCAIRPDFHQTFVESKSCLRVCALEQYWGLISDQLDYVLELITACIRCGSSQLLCDWCKLSRYCTSCFMIQDGKERVVIETERRTWLLKLTSDLSTGSLRMAMKRALGWRAWMKSWMRKGGSASEALA